MNWSSRRNPRQRCAARAADLDQLVPTVTEAQLERRAGADYEEARVELARQSQQVDLVAPAPVEQQQGGRGIGAGLTWLDNAMCEGALDGFGHTGTEQGRLLWFVVIRILYEGVARFP
ncbi:MAG: hypothetical protein WKH64_11215 [Chloroflexia bacterium]